MAEEQKNTPIEDDIDLIDFNDDVEILADVQVPDRFFNRLKFGSQVLDELFGGADFPGLMASCSILWTGEPGSGKSTIVLQLSDLLQENAGRSICYNAGEESKHMVKIRADRLGLKGKFAISHFDDINKLVKYVKTHGVEILIVDSIQQLYDSDKPELDGKGLLKRLGKKLHKLAKDEDIVVICIGHVTKSGNFAGPMELKHDLDLHAHIRFNADTGSRELFLTKNRFGPAAIPYELNLTARGFDLASIKQGEGRIEEGEEGTTGGETRAHKRKEAILKLIEKEFLGGEHISGYCFNRFKDPFTDKVGVDCSGGFWRGMVERARREMEAQGITFGEEKKDGRTYVYISV